MLCSPGLPIASFPESCFTQSEADPEKGTLMTRGGGETGEEASPKGEKAEDRKAWLGTHTERAPATGSCHLFLILKVIWSHLREWRV